MDSQYILLDSQYIVMDSQYIVIDSQYIVIYSQYIVMNSQYIVMDSQYKHEVLNTNIDLKLLNASHGPMYYKIGVTCVYNVHVFYTRFVITQQSNPPISHFNSPCNEFRSFGSMFVYNTHFRS